MTQAPRQDMPKRIQILRDHNGNTMQVGKDLSHEAAFEKLSEGYPLELFTYVLQPVKKIDRVPAGHGE